MVQLYAKGTTDFTKNGISLHPSESTVTFQDNGQYDLEIVVPAQSEYTSFDYGQILRATVPQHHDTVGEYKCDAAKSRILSINPDSKVTVHNVFFDESTKGEFDFGSYDYVVDAIDSLGAKIELIASAKAQNTPIISAMGAGNKLDPTRFEVSDISKTEVCPLARAVRTSLKKRGIYHLKVVYSKEPPVVPPVVSDGERRRVPASISFVPSAMGLIIAGEVINELRRK